ncbi:MAG: PLP-dependent aspartate aminotransferase family protein [Anaerolineales bacterium]
MANMQTVAVHAGARQAQPDYHPVVPPLYQSVAYYYDDMADLDAVFGGEADGYVYARYGSPTVTAFEEAVAALESAPAGVAFASGMAAMHAALLTAGVRSGSNVVCATDVYGATYALLARLLSDLGVQSTFVDVCNLDAVRMAIESCRPAAVVCETLSNPLLRVANIPALATMAHANGGQLVVDNTFATPYLCRPLSEGADLVVHSVTKYLAGHGDVLAGIVLSSTEQAHTMRENQKLLGANLAPEPAWLAHRGLRTFFLRVREQFTNAQLVAEWLARQPGIDRVHYPGLASHPQHELAARLFADRGFGGMMSFELRGADRVQVFRFMDALRMVLPATTLGDVFSLVLYPAHSSHRPMPPEMRAALGITDGLVRLSTGIEAPGDIIADLAQALASIGIA